MATDDAEVTTSGAALPGRQRIDGAVLSAFQGMVGEIFRLNGELLAAGERLGRDLGVSPARWQIMATLRSEPVTVPDVARRLGLARQSVQRTVNLLIRDGLARRRANPNHRRSHLVALTRQGRELTDRLRERQRPLTGLFTRDLGLGIAELEELTRQLQRLRAIAQRIAR